MKHLVLTLSLAATLATPLAASAMTQSDGVASAANHYLIVDTNTGRTVATLLPVDGQPHQLRIVGTIPAPTALLAPAAAPAALSPLTIGQQEKAREAAYRMQFQLPDATP